jgi:chitinase
MAFRSSALRSVSAFCALLVSLGLGATKRFPVIGYFPSWNGADPATIPWDKITHVNYAFINPTAAGGLTDANAEILGGLITHAHKHGVKVCLAVGGWNEGGTTDWESMAARPKSRQRFIKNLVDLCDAYHLDGIDIDWEYPKAASANDYALMMKELGAALHKDGRILSTAVLAIGDLGQHIHTDVFAALDFLNIMAYDKNWDKPALPHSTFGLADSALAYWAGRGCPKEKLVLGVPFYGRQPETAYRELAGRDKNAHNLDQVGSVMYNGIPTIRAKTRLAMEKAGGIMIWELTQDTRDSTSLLSAIDATARSAPGPGVTVSPTSAPAAAPQPSSNQP